MICYLILFRMYVNWYVCIDDNGVVTPQYYDQPDDCTSDVLFMESVKGCAGKVKGYDTME